MKIVRKIKQATGARKLKKEAEPQRHRAGSNFNTAQKIGLVYKDEDEAHFNRVKVFAKLLKENYKTKVVWAIGFVDEVYKRLPTWQAQKLEFGFFTREDLSWHRRPIKNVKPFITEEFDILIDLTAGDIVPTNFIMKESRAMMKVCRKGSLAEPFCDFIIDLPANSSLATYIEQINAYLSNPKIQ